MALAPAHRRSRRPLGCVAAGLIVLLQPALGIAQQPTLLPRLPPPSELKDHIAVSLGCAGGPAAVKVRVANHGVANATVLLGQIVGDSLWHMPLGFAFEDEGGLLFYLPAALPGIAGRIDPWEVIVPGGASFSFAVQATDFVHIGKMAEGLLRLQAFQGDLRARWEGWWVPRTDNFGSDVRMPVVRLLTGSAESNALHIADCGP